MNVINMGLLNSKLEPMTSTIVFFESQSVRAADAFIAWQEPIQQRRGVNFVRRHLRGTLESILRNLLPLTTVEARRFLFVPAKNGWTAFFDNGHRGTNPSSYVSKILNCRAVRMTLVPHSFKTSSKGEGGRSGATVFALFDPGSGQPYDLVRSVSVINDGGEWAFDCHGETQAFEHSAAYSAKRIRDRFTPQLLAEYLSALGIFAFDENFYESETMGAEHVEKKGPCAAKLEEVSLESVQSKLGLI